MGVIISLVYLPAKYFTTRRRKKKDNKATVVNQQDASPLEPSIVSPHQPSPSNPAPSPRRPSSKQADFPAASPSQEPPQKDLPPAEDPIPNRGPSPAPAADVRSTTFKAEGKGKEKGNEGEVEGQRSMASDEDYMAFLNKANEDPGKGYGGGAATSSSAPAKKGLKSLDVGAEIPRDLKGPTGREEWIYESEADEPFVPVSLLLEASSNRLPDEATFARLVGHPDAQSAQIEILDPVLWDRDGRYGEVVKAVRAACRGADVRVYRVRLGGTRVEYWVVGVDGEGKEGVKARLVGVKALAVES